MTAQATKTRRAIGIVRVSQRDDDGGHSPEVQARAMLKQAEGGDFALDAADIWDENIDVNGRVRPVSGGDALGDRPKLRAAVEAIERGQASVLVAERFDRFFRDLDLQREVIQRVEDAGGELITVEGKISHATADTELHANLSGAIAQYTKRTAKERSWDAVEIVIEEGRVPWKDTTPGYDIDEDGRLVPNAQAPIVRRAFRMRAKGATVNEVKAFLQKNGIERSFHGTHHLLSSRLVLGEIHFGKHTPNLQAHKPIVERNLWRRVQRMKSPRGRKPKSERLLARLGVLRCAHCDGRMVVGVQTQKGRRYAFYRCPGYVTGDCERRGTIGAEIVEKVVVDAVRERLGDAEFLATVESNSKEALDKLSRAQDDLNAAIRAFAGVKDEAAAKDRLDELREERDRAQERVDQLEAESVVPVRIAPGKEWGDLTLDEQRMLIRATVERVEVGSGRGAERVTVTLDDFDWKAERKREAARQRKRKKARKSR